MGKEVLPHTSSGLTHESSLMDDGRGAHRKLRQLMVVGVSAISVDHRHRL